MIKAPFQITSRVFKSDDGWSYRIVWWSGDEILKDPADGTAESTKAYKTEAMATRAMVAKFTQILTSPALTVKR